MRGAFHSLTLGTRGSNAADNGSGAEAGFLAHVSLCPELQMVSSSVLPRSPPCLLCRFHLQPCVCVVPSQGSRCCCGLSAQAARRAGRCRPWSSLVGRPPCTDLEEPGGTVALKCILACGCGEGSRGSHFPALAAVPGFASAPTSSEHHTRFIFSFSSVPHRCPPSLPASLFLASLPFSRLGEVMDAQTVQSPQPSHPHPYLAPSAFSASLSLPLFLLKMP